MRYILRLTVASSLLFAPALALGEGVPYPEAIHCVARPCVKGLPSCASEAHGNKVTITHLKDRKPFFQFDGLPYEKPVPGRAYDSFLGIGLPSVRVEFSSIQARLTFKRDEFESFAEGKSQSVKGTYERDLEEFHHSSKLEIECTKGVPVPASIPPHQPLEAVIATCASCHGTDGSSTAPGVPNIGGMRKDQLAAAMRDYRIGARNDTAMNAMADLAASLTTEDTQAIAGYYAGRPVPPQATAPGPAKPLEALHSCCACHSKTGILADGPAGGVFLTSQGRDYLKAQLDAFNSGARSHLLMRYLVRQYTGEELTGLADYFAASTSDGVCKDVPTR